MNIKVIILVLVMGVPICFIGIFLIQIAIVHYWLSERQLRHELMRKGRYLPINRRQTPDADLTGTIVVDDAAFNHARIRYWWTPEDLISLAPVSVPEQPHDPLEDGNWGPFDRWIFERFLNRSTGTAQLLSTEIERRSRRELIRARFPQCRIVATYSAGQHIESVMRKTGTDENNKSKTW